jgi:uncharacterized membrane protein YdcZ (DUF606 family)
MKMAPAISLATQSISMRVTSKRVAINQSMISFVVGIVVLLCVAIFARHGTGENARTSRLPVG